MRALALDRYEGYNPRADQAGEEEGDQGRGEVGGERGHRAAHKVLGEEHRAKTNNRACGQEHGADAKQRAGKGFAREPRDGGGAGGKYKGAGKHREVEAGGNDQNRAGDKPRTRAEDEGGGKAQALVAVDARVVSLGQAMED